MVFAKTMIFCSILLATLSGSYAMSSETISDLVVENKFTTTIPVLFAAVFAQSDNNQQKVLLDSPYSLIESMERPSNDGLRESMSALDLQIYNRFKLEYQSAELQKTTSEPGSSIGYLDKSGIRNFVSTKRASPNSKYDQIAGALENEGYFEGLSSIHAQGLKSLISMYGYDGMEFHPWAAIAIDEEEITDLSGQYFFDEMSAVFSRLGLEMPEIDIYYSDDGALVMEMEDKEHVLAKGSEVGDWFSYIATMNIYKILNDLIQQSNRRERIFSLFSNGATTALILTPEQQLAINALDTAVDDYNKPRVRTYADTKL